MRRVILNGQSYAVGLDWFLLQRMTRAEVIQEAERYDDKSDLVVILKEQYALARSGKRTWRKTRSLAASLVLNGFPDAVHVYPLVDADTNNQFWWVIGVRKGIVSGQTDRYFDNRNDAESVAVSVQDSLGVPEMKSFPKDDSQNHLLSRIGRPKKTLMGDPTALTYLKDTALIKLAKAAAIAIGLGIGWWSVDAILDYRATQEALEQARILTQNKEKRARELAEHPEKYFQSGWMTAPEADAFINQCVPAMFHFPTAANGWRLTELSSPAKM